MPGESDVERAWADEIERRVAEIDSGEAELIPGEQVMAEMRALLRIEDESNRSLSS